MLCFIQLKNKQKFKQTTLTMDKKKYASLELVLDDSVLENQ